MSQSSTRFRLISTLRISAQWNHVFSARSFSTAIAIAPAVHNDSDGSINLMTASMNTNTVGKTQILPIDSSAIGTISSQSTPWIENWSLDLLDSASAKNLREAARQIRETNTPVAFPTETVYGLGADATRDSAVKAIYRVKGRPSDNPLIVHFASIQQIRELLQNESLSDSDPIPSIYRLLIEKFWPGPLTILLPLPNPSPLAPSVTVGLKTFGARIPRNPVALSLLRLANVPVAAPSANASTKPSPTTAEHVAHDLDGRITHVLDGGPCDVGLESTVVDGLCSPPAILRPGGVSVEQLRQCSGWENVKIAYADKAEESGAPRAPGMKYRHYSPKARVILYESGQEPNWVDINKAAGSLGFIVTKNWRQCALFQDVEWTNPVGQSGAHESNGETNTLSQPKQDLSPMFDLLIPVLATVPSAQAITIANRRADESRTAWMIDLGPNTKEVARGIFSALRELDRRDVDTIFVEGLDEDEGDVAVAVMNRLRKAAEVKVS